MADDSAVVMRWGQAWAALLSREAVFSVAPPSHRHFTEASQTQNELNRKILISQGNAGKQF